MLKVLNLACAVIAKSSRESPADTVLRETLRNQRELSRDEVLKIFAHLHGTARLMAGLLYGSGLRLMECVRLRVKDVDFAYARITVRDTKGGRDRVTMLPVNLTAPLQRHLQKVKAQQ